MNRLMNSTASSLRVLAIAAAMVATSAATAFAQTATGPGDPGSRIEAGPRWQAWHGCWTAAPIELVSNASAPMICVTPTANINAVDIATISGGKVLSTQRLDASGRELPVEAKGCTGTQRAEWSADERRVYLRSVATCDGVRRVTTGILAMTASGDWLDVQATEAGGGENVRVARYHDAGLLSSVPANIAAALEGRSNASLGARVSAGATVGTAAVIEATNSVSAAAVEAWLLERGQEFGLDARTLLQLADAGVPARVTDAMVAVSNPKEFVIAHPDDRSRVRVAEDTTVVGNRIYVTMEPVYSPFSWGYGAYGYGRGYGYPYGYGYSPYGYGYPAYGAGGYYGGAPIIVVGQPTATVTNHGKMVKGQGYTPSASSAATSTSGSRPSSSSGSTSSGSSGSSTSTPASTPAPAPERTAKPRP